MKKITKVVISIIVACLIITIPIVGISLVSLNKFDERESELRVDLFKLKPSQNYEISLGEADLRYELNEEGADSAPKQTVLALWNIMDKQSLIIMENSDLMNQNYELARHNDNIIMQTEILINNQNQIQLLLMFLLVSISIIGLSVILILWSKKAK